MFKLIAICLTLCVASQAFSIKQSQARITDEVLALARWSATQLEPYTGIEGDYTVLTVRNLNVDGPTYQYTVDLLVQTPEYQYLFRSCDLTVYYQKSTEFKQIVGTPKCGPHPNYQ
ncbi:unnamed protein product [Brachionus calyciflorus]|uniref:Uncharacterized protein n=1 Tax=Brachionus calyciflorus TaxID=104777 RepID=A0A813TG07_9BILA|nr:unnamed protein product [Brachionus calyciflorus]